MKTAGGLGMRVVRRNPVQAVGATLFVALLLSAIATGQFGSRRIDVCYGYGLGYGGGPGYSYGYYSCGSNPGGGGGGGGGNASQTLVAGGNRDETAIAASKLTYPAAGSASVVVLARNDIFADALAGGRLATALGGPLLLTPSSSIDPETEAEIKRVLPTGKTVYILGGSLAIATTVDSALVADGFQVVREAGDTRFETAVKVANADQGQTTAAAVSTSTSPIFVATGLVFPDGLAADATAATTKGVVLLSSGNQPTTATTNYIAAHPTAPVYAVGGPAAAAYPSATPIVGLTRYETAAMLAAKFFTSPTVVGIATGVDFPDALSGGAAIGHFGGPLLLTDSQTLSTATQGYLSSNAKTITTDYVFGGSNAISTGVRQAIQDALGSTQPAATGS